MKSVLSPHVCIVGRIQTNIESDLYIGERRLFW
jgi:hypothetical protein